MTSNNDDPLERARAQIRQVIETEIELGIMIHDYQATAEGKEGLMNRVNLLVKEFEQLNQLAGPLDEHVPLDVVDYIENGRNPDVYTREFVELLSKQNQYVNGKMQAMGHYRDSLAAQLKEAYPDMGGTIDQVVERTQ